jgi:hypothetical protein
MGLKKQPREDEGQWGFMMKPVNMEEGHGGTVCERKGQDGRNWRDIGGGGK